MTHRYLNLLRTDEDDAPMISIAADPTSSRDAQRQAQSAAPRRAVLFAGQRRHASRQSAVATTNRDDNN
jgi:hypothetical protein